MRNGTLAVQYSDSLPLLSPATAVHHRRVAALKALSCAPVSNDEAYAALVQIIFAMLDSVSGV